MKVETRTVTEVLFVLNEHDARWLMAYVQNPMCEPDKECEQDSRMREKLFFAIQKALRVG